MRKQYPDKRAFKLLCDRHKDEQDCFTFADFGAVFGPEFYELLVMSLMDSQDAARAIQGAIAKLRTESRETSN